MKRMLVVVDGSVQGSLALDRAIEIASGMPNVEIVLLCIRAPLPAWQPRREAASRASTDISERITARALARAISAGVPSRARMEIGEKAEVAATVAREEHCDHIFLPEPERTSVARAITSLTGLSTATAASRVLSLSTVPVTVFAHDR